MPIRTASDPSAAHTHTPTLTLALAALLALLTTALLLLAIRPPTPQWRAGDLVALDSVEVVRSETLDAPAPSSDWQAISLPDNWATRWPAHDGVVWYRLQFTVPTSWSPDRALGLAMGPLNMAGAVWLDGVSIARDEGLAEPMARMWNQSRYWHLGRPGEGLLAGAGPHTLLVQVAGYAAYAGGMDQVWVGDAQSLQRLIAQDQWWRVGLQQWSLGANMAVALLFLVLWVCWPRERLYGWFALTSLAWSATSYNQIAVSVWPLATTHQFQITVALAFGLFAASYALFVFRFTAQRFPRIERVLAGSMASALVASLATLAWWPAQVVPLRTGLILASALVFFASAAYVWGHAWRTRKAMPMALALTLVIPVAAGLHDLAALMQWLPSTRYYTLPASTLLLVSMALLLAWRLRSAFEREAYFNQDLRARVDAARTDLAAALQREHDLEIHAARHAERLGMVRDLHDGLGGTLVSAQARLQQAPEVLAVLRQMNDDLRLIIDSSHLPANADFLQLLAPTRSRLMQRFEDAGMAALWQTSGLDGLHLPSSRALHILRFLQEAATNAIKHSHAAQVVVSLRYTDGLLHIEVQDNGAGFDTARPASGLGQSSMRQRALALGATLRLESAPGEGCQVRLQIPIPPHSDPENVLAAD